MAIPWTQVYRVERKGWFPLKNLDIRYIPQYYLVDPQGKFVLMGASIQESAEIHAGTRSFQSPGPLMCWTSKKLLRQLLLPTRARGSNLDLYLDPDV